MLASDRYDCGRIHKSVVSLSNNIFIRFYQIRSKHVFQTPAFGRLLLHSNRCKFCMDGMLCSALTFSDADALVSESSLGFLILSFRNLIHKSRDSIVATQRTFGVSKRAEKNL